MLRIFALFVALAQVAAHGADLPKPFRGYHVGLALRTAVDNLYLSYRIRKSNEDARPQECREESKLSGDWICSARLASKNSGGYTLFLQKPFERTGWFYFSGESTFGVRYIETRMAPRATASKAPLHDFRAVLAGINGTYYWRLGVTPPRYLPDLFVSAGFSSALTGGEVRINRDFEPSLFWNPVGLYLGAEAVLLRFLKAGEFGLSFSTDSTTSWTVGKLYKKEKDSMRAFTPTVSTFWIGFRLLSPW